MLEVAIWNNWPHPPQHKFFRTNQKMFMLPTIRTKNCSGPKIVLVQIFFFWSKVFTSQFFYQNFCVKKFFWAKFFLQKKIFIIFLLVSTCISDKNSFDSTFFRANHFFEANTILYQPLLCTDATQTKMHLFMDSGLGPI